MCGLLLTVMAIADEPAPLYLVRCERESRPSTSPLPWRDGSWAARYLVALISVGVLGGHLDQGNRYHEPPPPSGTAMNRMCLDDPSWTTPAEKQGAPSGQTAEPATKLKTLEGVCGPHHPTQRTPSPYHVSLLKHSERHGQALGPL
jgi:hypothetical protein